MAMHVAFCVIATKEIYIICWPYVNVEEPWLINYEERYNILLNIKVNNSFHICRRGRADEEAEMLI